MTRGTARCGPLSSTMVVSGNLGYMETEEIRLSGKRFVEVSFFNVKFSCPVLKLL